VGLREALTPPWARACRPLHLKRFSTQVCVETCKGHRAQPATEVDGATYVKGLGRASGPRGLGLRPRPDPYHELRPLPLGTHAPVVVEDAVAPWALHPANVVESEAPRPEDPELALVAAVRALDQAVPRSLPVSPALKRFQPGLRGLEVIALLGRITTALNRALSQSIRESALKYKDM